MNEGRELGNPPNLQTSMYFCTTCGKPFDQEISYTRHVQYCRRRAAKKRPARQQACQFCRSTKSKCDFLSPCTRCVTKNRICSYDQHYGVSTSVATNPNDAVSSVNSVSNPLSAAGISPVGHFNASASVPCLDFGPGLELAPQPDNLRFDDATRPHLDQETFHRLHFLPGTNIQSYHASQSRPSSILVPRLVPTSNSTLSSLWIRDLTSHLPISC